MELLNQVLNNTIHINIGTNYNKEILRMRVVIYINNRIILLILLCIILIGCDKLNTKDQHVYPKSISINANDNLVVELGFKNYNKFEGTYPTNWPSWFKLPDSFYLGANEGNIIFKDNINVLFVKGIMCDSSSDSLKYFEDLLKSNSIQYHVSQSQRIVTDNCPDNIDVININISPSETNSNIVGILIQIWLKN
jgi:hypothetical protein